MALFGNDREGGMLDGLKSRLGFGDNDTRESSRYAADEAFDDYDNDLDDSYDEYGDYDEFEEYGANYNENTAQPGAYRPAQPRSSRSDFPRLVSIDDVKASTPLPESLTRDPLEPVRRTRIGERTVLDETTSPVGSPAHNAAQRDSRRKSEGLNSLFEPTTSDSYDPYEAYSSSTPSTHTPARAISVIKPVSYSDVERVAKTVKSGDVVVLCLRNTPDALSKRILDFSFGVASALDASVECPGDKVFSISRGSALSDDEKRRLRNQGVL